MAAEPFDCTVLLFTINTSLIPSVQVQKLPSSQRASAGLASRLANSFPHLQLLYGNCVRHFEAQFHVLILDGEHRDFEHAVNAILAADHHGFVACS